VKRLGDSSIPLFGSHASPSVLVVIWDGHETDSSRFLFVWALWYFGDLPLDDEEVSYGSGSHSAWSTNMNRKASNDSSGNRYVMGDDLFEVDAPRRDCRFWAIAIIGPLAMKDLLSGLILHLPPFTSTLTDYIWLHINYQDGTIDKRALLTSKEDDSITYRNSVIHYVGNINTLSNLVGPAPVAAGPLYLCYVRCLTDHRSNAQQFTGVTTSYFY
jgi:hypothetical protein